MLAALAILALVIFIGGEVFAFATSDHGRVLLYRHLHLGDRAQIVRIVAKGVREGLADARLPGTAWREDVAASPAGGTPHWRVDLQPDGAPLQVNYAVTQAVERAGAQVLSGREDAGEGGALTVRLAIGFPGRVLHEVVIARPGRVHHEDEPPAPIRIALVLVGAADAPDAARELLARDEPFALAVTGIADGRAALRKLARAHGHEVVLQVAMEPENYPRVNPGPGTLLVSWPSHRIEGSLRDQLKDAGDVAAVSNFMGSFATQDEPFMTAFYRELRKQGVGFLHVQPVPRSVCRSLAANLGVAYDEPDATLDLEARESKTTALERAWKSVLDRAEKRGRAIVVLRVTPTSAKWLAAALEPKARGAVTIVPLTSLVHQPSRPE